MTYDLEGFRKFAAGLKVEGGRPLRLGDFQVDILRDHFGPATEEVVVIPKKNGKTTLLAALALFHISEVPQADVPVLASSIKQSGVMFKQAEKLVRNSGVKVETRKDVYTLAGVTYEVRPGYKEIRANGGMLYVVANDATTLDGVIPTLGLIDELHRHKNAENYGLISDGLGPVSGKMVTISTAGADERSPLGVLRTRAHEYRNRKVDDRHTRYASGSTVLHEWALLEEDDPDDFHDVKRANPAKMQTLAELRRRRADPMMTTGRWLRFACGIWTAGEEPSFTGAEWDGLRADAPWQLQPSEPCVLAPSIGGNAAVALAAMRDDGKIAVRVEHLEAGGSIQVRTEALVRELCGRWNVAQIAYPQGQFSRSFDELEASGLPLVAAHPSPARLVAATGTFDRVFNEGLLIHDGDPITRAQVLNAARKSSETGERFLPGDSSRAIGAIVMAVHHATALPLPAPEYVAL